MQKNKKYPEHTGKNNANWRGGKPRRVCEICQKVFYAYVDKKHKGRFCSTECRGIGYRGANNPCYRDAMTTKKCNWCNNDFESYKYREAKFCSMRCTTMFTLKYHIKQKDTDIEIIIEDWLKKSGVKYEKQKPIGNFTIVDFFIEPDWCLYADGDYWHSKPERIKKDLNINRRLKEMGFFVQRISGSAIHKNKEFFNVGTRPQ